MLLLAVISVFLIFPLILKIKFMRNLIQSTSIKLLAGITSIIVFILILTWQGAQKFWKRYRATRDTKRFPLISVELLFIYILFTACLSFIFVDIAPSAEFWIFLGTNFLFISGWAISSRYYKATEKAKEAPRSSETISDEPIYLPEQDLLRRGKFVDDLYRGIVNLPTPLTGSFTFGLYGSWGEGKTSAINLLINKFMNDEKNQNFLIIRFDPWYFHDEKAILTAFYNQIEKAISDKYIFPDFKKAILRYQKAIETGISVSGFNFGFRIAENSVEKTQERIEGYIGQINKKLLIIIDDIDRLQPEETELVFKLVRKNTDFKNTIFLLSFDLMIIKKCLGQKVRGSPEFLDKIINKPIHLPAIEQDCIDEFLFAQIEILLEKIGIREEEKQKFEESFSSLYKSELSKLFRTVRQVKRFMNCLYATFPSMKSEINLYDFLVLEVIKIFKPELYKDIWLNPWIYLESNYMTMWSSPFNTFIPGEDEEENKFIKKHLDNLLGESAQDIFGKLLYELFPKKLGKALPGSHVRYIRYSKGDDRWDKRISHPDCFYKYFTFLTPSSEISDEYIELTIDLWRTRNPDERKSLIMKEFFKDQENKKTHKLLQKLLDFIEKIDSSLALSIIETIYENADRFLGNGEYTFFDSEFLKAEVLMLLLINDKIEKKTIPGVIEDAVMNSSDLLFSVDVVRRCKKGKDEGFSNIFDSIDTEYLQNQLSTRLKKYFIDGKRDFFEIISENAWFFFLYEWYYSLTGDEGTNKKIINDYVLSLVKDDAKKLSNLLVKFAKINEMSGEIVNFGKFKDIFSYEDFEEIARKFKDSQLLSDEGRIVINKFLEQVPKKSPQ